MKKMEPEQLKRLLENDLFTEEKLTTYEEQKRITPDQVKVIKDILTQNGNKLTESSLKQILSGAVLSAVQIEGILKQIRWTEKRTALSI